MICKQNCYTCLCMTLFNSFIFRKRPRPSESCLVKKLTGGLGTRICGLHVQAPIPYPLHHRHARYGEPEPRRRKKTTSEKGKRKTLSGVHYRYASSLIFICIAITFLWLAYQKTFAWNISTEKSDQFIGLLFLRNWWRFPCCTFQQSAGCVPQRDDFGHIEKSRH